MIGEPTDQEYEEPNDIPLMPSFAADSTHPRSLGLKIVAAVFALTGAALFAAYGSREVNALYDLVMNHWLSGDPTHVLPLRGAAGDFAAFPEALLGLVVGGYFGIRLYNGFAAMGRRWDQMDLGDKVTASVGIVFGIIATFPFYLVVESLFESYQVAYKAATIIALVFAFSIVSIYALTSMHEILPWYRNRGQTRRSGIKILDTNVLIDARIFDVAKTGFVEGELYVPQFVLEELQRIADHYDQLKRQRGRRGLAIVRQLQGEFSIEIGKYDKYAPDPQEEVDKRLVRLAKAIGADIVTNDWNLNNVARIQNVRILSLNELALTLRPSVLPSEKLEVRIIREGNQDNQGVAYLEDGTMIVVEGGRQHISETVGVTVTQVIQTERGKMIFAEVAGPDEEEDHYARRPRPK
jgi:uncharacterized protein YacL